MKLSPTQMKVLTKMANGCWLTQRNRAWLYDGKSPPEVISADTIHTLYLNGLLDHEYGFPADTYTLTEKAFQLVNGGK